MNEAPSQTRREEGLIDSQAVPDVIVEKRRSPSLVWLIPLVAALIGVWLAYQTFSEQGPTVTITFKEGTGLEAGKTKIKYKALEVGTVDTIRFSDDLSHVILTAQLSKDVAQHLGKDTKFWVVRPRVGISGVSGLETLVSGAYIEVEFGSGAPARAFTGLEQPPIVKSDTTGRQYLLLAEKIGSLQHGSPVYFRDIQVGEVLTTALAEDKQSVLVHIFINAPYHLLVRDNSRFWKTSGLDVSLGAQGIDVKMESLLTFLAGGIAFDTPDEDGASIQPSQDGAQFRLYDNFASISEATYTEKHPYVMYFDGSVRGLSKGAPVEFRGIKIGSVTDVKLEVDVRNMDIRLPVTVELEPERISAINLEPAQIADLTKTPQGQQPGMEKLVERGLRAQLKTGSLLTGQLYVDLDFYPNTPLRRLSYAGRYPELPTVPSTLDTFQKTATEVLADLQKLPLEKIANELLGTLQGVNRLVNSPELKSSIRSLDASLKSLQTLTQSADRQVATLASSTEKTLNVARAVLETAEPGSPTMVDMANALEQLAAAARSIRALSDYLERHPEALLYGKAGTGTK